MGISLIEKEQNEGMRTGGVGAMRKNPGGVMQPPGFYGGSPMGMPPQGPSPGSLEDHES